MIPRMLLTLLLLFGIGYLPSCRGDDDFLREINTLIREVGQRHEDDDVDENDSVYRKGLELLRKVRRLQTRIGHLEEQAERAEEHGDDDEAEEYWEEAGQHAQQIEHLMVTAELLEPKLELNAFVRDLREENLSELAEEAESLLQLQDERIRELNRLFEMMSEDEDLEHIEEQLESLEREFERRSSLLEVRVDLHWAREENDRAAIRELERRLRRLNQDIEDDEGADDDDDDVESIRRMRRSGGKADRNEAGRRPVEITQQDVLAAAQISFESDILPLLRSHCLDCHGATDASGDLNLESLAGQQPFVVNRRHWLNVKQQLRVRSMPPSDAEAPPENERRLLIAWLTHAIDQFDYSTVRQPGYEPARRLTHEEYNNTLCELFGVDLRPADRFPADLKATSGFNNSANSLFIQPILLERYVNAAEQVVLDTLSPEAPIANRRAAEQIVIGNQSPKAAVLRFAERAWRRPLETMEEAQLTSFFDKAIRGGRTGRQALLETIQVILISPRFLIRTEHFPDTSGGAFEVSDYELASRLSYFLWASMPDPELFEKAADGSLREPRVMGQQVDRMLHDKKSHTLGSLFAAQWLGFGNLHHIKPDQIDNPWATDSLLRAMKEESALLFNSIVKDDAPIETLITADYTFVNEELARHYGMRGIREQPMQRVSLKEQGRGGILGHGSILAITSFPGRTSPVVRGNWILSELLGTPPPPPPPNVSQFDEELEERVSLSAREKLELHRRNPNCNACHREIDPLGFALEEFDWFGRQYTGRRRRNTDVRGELPSGTVVHGLAGLREALVAERRDDLVEQITRRMLSYALGRQLEYYDEATVRDIIDKVESSDRRLQSLIHAIVRSDAFRMKQVPAGTEKG